MKMLHNSILLSALLLLLYACQPKEKDVVVEKIQYDVNIKSPDPSYDWWIQNLPGPQRENLVDMIVDGALSGKYQAYDYFNHPISKDDVKKIFSDTTYYTIIDEKPPYSERDTMVIGNILREDILRIRFLESWWIDPESLQMEKKILGIAPIARRPDLMGIERWQPLFWIYTDEDFIKTLQKDKTVD